jgi:serine/threonine protein kinase
MVEEEKTAICPNCEARTTAGSPCRTPGCAELGLVAFPTRKAPPKIAVLSDPHIGRSVGQFPIVDKLGSGAFGSVYLGLQPPFWNPVAIKLLELNQFPVGLEESIRAKFEAEAEALSVLRHPNIVQLVHYSADTPKPFLAMEYVSQGVTLSDDIETRITDGRTYSAGDLKSILGQLLDGLGAAHENGIIHRDVKPSNIMLQRVKGHDRLLRILDFGLAKFLERGTETAVTSGTPDYISPEQLHREDLGPWSDLYSAGTIAFELMTGRKLIRADTLQQVFLRKIDPRFDPTEGIADLELPDSALLFFKRALSVNHEHRFRNADAMKNALNRALEDLGRAPNRPLERITLEDLERPTGNSRSSTVIPGSGERGDAAPRDSNDAFRRWLELEHDRLHKKT